MSPDWAHLYERETTLGKLRELLQEESALIVGEIGVDKHWITSETGANEFEKQVDMFEPQFDLAVEIKRPVVIHCVRCHGYLSEFLRLRASSGQMPPSIYLHAFAGSAEMAKQLLKLIPDRVFFGFAASVNMRNEDKLRDLLAIIPLAQLLLESDAETPDKVDEDIHKVATVMAEVKGLTCEEIYSVTKENVNNFLFRTETPVSDQQMDYRDHQHPIPAEDTFVSKTNLPGERARAAPAEVSTSEDVSKFGSVGGAETLVARCTLRVLAFGDSLTAGNSQKYMLIFVNMGIEENLSYLILIF